MSAQDLDRPPDPDGPHARWWEDVYTLGWGAQRQDGDTIRLDQGLHGVLDRLIGRCAASCTRSWPRRRPRPTPTASAAACTT